MDKKDFFNLLRFIRVLLEIQNVALKTLSLPKEGYYFKDRCLKKRPFYETISDKDISTEKTQF
ncbi:hypothetical protein LV84_02132 [Algoriphagus ratkowskyi]|uniref:Uncharacterized protein n=1 Tax=Algoriphagus ratkowskyi TaxID=57028 RepID=A0A2W7RAB2_9BACT|nr:hypothetical protein LV84_02132 [Algoriphagus ratkowskyi]